MFDDFQIHSTTELDNSDVEVIDDGPAAHQLDSFYRHPFGSDELSEVFVGAPWEICNEYTPDGKRFLFGLYDAESGRAATLVPCGQTFADNVPELTPMPLQNVQGAEAVWFYRGVGTIVYDDNTSDSVNYAVARLVYRNGIKSFVGARAVTIPNMSEETQNSCEDVVVADSDDAEETQQPEEDATHHASDNRKLIVEVRLSWSDSDETVCCSLGAGDDAMG